MIAVVAAAAAALTFPACSVFYFVVNPNSFAVWGGAGRRSNEQMTSLSITLYNGEADPRDVLVVPSRCTAELTDFVLACLQVLPAACVCVCAGGGVAAASLSTLRLLVSSGFSAASHPDSALASPRFALTTEPPGRPPVRRRAATTHVDYEPARLVDHVRSGRCGSFGFCCCFVHACRSA